MLSSSLHKTFNPISTVFAVLLALSFSQAQDAHPLPRHPGDVIKFEVKFDGPNADKIKTVNVLLRLRAAVPQDHDGFSAGFGGDSVQSSAPNTFRPEIKIPDNAASGDYFLDVNAAADGSAGSASYRDGAQFHLNPIHIENTRTFVPPHITVTEQH